jgi:hypothetical protein
MPDQEVIISFVTDGHNRSSEIHTKHINTLCGQNVEFLNFKPGGKYSDHWDF